MIFLDETGKRWKVVKRSACTAGLALVTPVLLLAAGAYIFNPAWSTLQLRPFIEATSPRSTTTNAPEATSVLGAHTASGQLALLVPQPTTISAPVANTTTNTTTTQPAPAPTPAPAGPATQSTPTSNARTTEPGNSSSGLSHHFTKQ